MKLPRRKFLHLAAGAAALPAVSRIARAQAYPTRPAARQRPPQDEEVDGAAGSWRLASRQAHRRKFPHGGGAKPPSGGHPVGRDAERSEMKRAFCSSLSEL